VVAGFVDTPKFLGDIHAFTDFLHMALPPVTPVTAGALGGMSELGSESLVTVAFLMGLYVAYLFFIQKRELADKITAPAFAKAIHRFWFTDWGMDWLYERVFVRPIIWVARVDKSDFVDYIYSGIALITELLYHGVRKTETGRIRWYAAAIAAGSVIFLAIVLFL